MTAYKIIVAAMALICLSFGCGDGDSDLISGTGTISLLDLEGGCWVITDDTGPVYEPIDMPSEFRVEGLRVRFELEPMDDTSTICMAGRPVSVRKIEELE